MATRRLPALFDQNDARQLIHITYGLILSAKDESGAPRFKTRLSTAGARTTRSITTALSSTTAGIWRCCTASGNNKPNRETKKERVRKSGASLFMREIGYASADSGSFRFRRDWLRQAPGVSP
jgi:hypothetical protein